MKKLITIIVTPFIITGIIIAFLFWFVVANVMCVIEEMNSEEKE